MKKSLSILIYSLASGGAERVVSILLNELKERYDITLFLMNDTIFYDISKDIKTIYIENSSPNESGIKKLLKLPVLAWRYKKLNSTDISLSFMNRPNYINILAKIFGMKSKVIISERIAPSQEYKTTGIKDKISRTLIKSIYPKADLIIPNAIGIKNDLIDNFNIDSSKLKVINNPLDVEKIKNISKEEVSYRDKNFTFITIGRMHTQKNHKLMIEAMQNIDAKLYIIGDGKLRDILEKKIESLSLQNKVFLLGKQQNPYKYLVQADCFVFSSLYEGFPNVLLEALACKLPIISSDCQSGPREILTPNSDVNFQIQNDIEIADYGILTPINDVVNLQKAMNLIMNDENLRVRYKEKAIIRVKDFNVYEIVSQFEDILNA